MEALLDDVDQTHPGNEIGGHPRIMARKRGTTVHDSPLHALFVGVDPERAGQVATVFGNRIQRLVEIARDRR